MQTLDPDRTRRLTGATNDMGNPKHFPGLEISQSDDGCVISRPGQDRIHFLNPTAVLILELCTGENTPEQIVELVKSVYELSEAPVDDVYAVLNQLSDAGLLI